MLQSKRRLPWPTHHQQIRHARLKLMLRVPQTYGAASVLTAAAAAGGPGSRAA